jgi:hypothetical protein
VPRVRRILKRRGMADPDSLTHAHGAISLPMGSVIIAPLTGSTVRDSAAETGRERDDFEERGLDQGREDESQDKEEEVDERDGTLQHVIPALSLLSPSARPTGEASFSRTRYRGSNDNSGGGGDGGGSSSVGRDDADADAFADEIERLMFEGLEPVPDSLLRNAPEGGGQLVQVGLFVCLFRSFCSFYTCTEVLSGTL